MKCGVCNRDNLTEKELSIHLRFFHKQHIVALTQRPQRIATGVCPECGSTLWFEEGCATCHTCGFSKCS